MHLEMVPEWKVVSLSPPGRLKEDHQIWRSEHQPQCQFWKTTRLLFPLCFCLWFDSSETIWLKLLVDLIQNESSASFAYHSFWSPVPTQRRFFLQSRLFSSNFYYLKGKRRHKKLLLSHYLHNYSSGCQEIRSNQNQKQRKMFLFDRILIWQRLVRVPNAAWKIWFLSLLLSKQSFIFSIFDIIQKSIWLVARSSVKEGTAH